MRGGDGDAAGMEPIGPEARSVLSLQAVAGNAAVAHALRSGGRGVPGRPVIQRQPKPTSPPAWAAGAEAALKSLFPKEKLMQGVVIKDYADLNASHKDSPLDAWTGSGTEVYLKDPSGLGKTPALQGMKLRYVLQHEANHIRQFQGKGPPDKWELMVKYELEAYAKDLTWLAGDGKKIVTDTDLHKELVVGVNTNLASLRTIMKDVAKLKGDPRDLKILDKLMDAELVPPNATANPLDLYKQP